ncbi:N-acetyllactosaminide beta-1,3-N-acetylglucosaminyltransferase 3 [Tachyglossus aculeatus]|uniref:N-acetyllactosaminide beta-1,3-N-acetylglucosaminyltransferase 3 n=1 Tax=Tachyglossus aculeatus TaxID=9261 RepID=UPI0018F4396E|nr:N-acetyllactosaminide beta-1,3-N-acetylglucosaminyltransferase 3 [Tachyglossus aculeatus]
MLRCKFQQLEIALLLAMGLGALLFLLQVEHRELTHRIPQGVKLGSLPDISPPTVFSPPPAPCHANTSVVNASGFAELPTHIKNFLLYKHCRSFRLLQDALGKCGRPGASDEVFLLLAIKSSPANYERRELIRKTWGQERTVHGLSIRRLFLVGTASNALEARKLNRLLAMEALQHGDILQWDFHDSFFNLTLKQVLFLEWQAAHCPEARFLFNGDDDVFAHTDNMVVFLRDLLPDKHLFVGHLISHVGPIRLKYSKYYVPELVSQENSYPPYCGGGGMLMSHFTVQAIRRASLSIEFFPIDDVYLGMCLQREGLQPASHMGIRTGGVHVPSTQLGSFDPCYYRELLLVHRFVPYEMLLMWQALHEPGLVCGKRTLKYQRV